MLVDELALHHPSRSVHHGGDITDVALVGAVAIFISHPAGFQTAFVLADRVPVAGEVGCDAIVEVLDVVLPAESELDTVVGHLAEILVRG